jgi:hypothetical protein
MAGKPIADAVEDIAKRLDIRIGAAKAKLIDACHAGVIRAYWRGKYDRTSPLITRAEWGSADIDERSNLVILASGERREFVDLDKAD